MAQDQFKAPLNLEIAPRSAPSVPAAAESEQNFDTRGPDVPMEPDVPIEKNSFTTKYFENFPDEKKNEPVYRKQPLAKSFGRYQLQSVLGRGGMGEVYLAYDTVLLRNVALKAPRLADASPAHRERFNREAIAAGALHHPNICPLHDFGDVDGQLYFTMAYVDGEPLSAFLKKNGPLDADHAVRLVHKVALAMHHAHEHGVLHRDLKPGNILLTKKGEPIVTDFGLAFKFDAETSNRLTETGLVVGTPTYMPPEQINGQPLGPTADVYSLGVVFYELLTGKPPFEGSLGKLIAQIENSSPEPPSQVRSLREPQRGELDEELEKICLKAIAKSPSDRFPNMAVFAEALDRYAEEKRARFVADQAIVAMRRKVRRRVAILVSVMALALAATISAAVIWVRQADRDIVPVPEMQPTDADRLFEALLKPLVKIDCQTTEDAPLHLGRNFIPPSLLLLPAGNGQTRMHEGPLYFSVSGVGTGHVLDFSDQPGQAAQITNFGGEITVTAPYLLFVGNLTGNSRVYIKGGIGYSILAPMNGGIGSKHVEFDGTHFLEPKLGVPKIDTMQTTGAERAALRNPDLIQKVVWSYDRTEYVIYCRPGTQVVPGNHEQRRAQFPAVYEIIEADRRRQGDAPHISNARLQQALREVGR
jgi:hypothetical protein